MGNEGPFLPSPAVTMRQRRRERGREDGNSLSVSAHWVVSTKASQGLHYSSPPPEEEGGGAGVACTAVKSRGVGRARYRALRSTIIRWPREVGPTWFGNQGEESSSFLR